MADGVVYVGSEDNNLYALDTSTGTKIWSFSTGWDITSSPAVAGGVVYVGSQDRSVYALDATTGEELWRFPTGWQVYSSPTVAAGIVYVAAYDGNLYALDALTGDLLWSFSIGAFGMPSPAVAGGVVYAGSFADNLYALDASTWQCNASGDKLFDHEPNGVPLILRRQHFCIHHDLVAGEVAAVCPGTITRRVLSSQPYLIVRGFGERQHLLDVEQDPSVDVVRHQAHTADVHAVEAVEPQYGRCDLAPEVCADEHNTHVA